MLENSAYLFWSESLNSAKYVLAPMVDQSELAWRLLSRKYGAQLCFTPMLHASVFVKDHRYRRENFVSCPEDRPLVVQFCANDPDIFVEACKLVVGHCEAVDLNLGCPQAIAKRGHYGAFLQDEWDLLQKMISRACTEVDIPITCKIRVFKDIELTVKYAKMLEAAGCKLLTVHGRTREQKGPMTGLASWEHIKAVKMNVSVPIFANGNIQYFSDVQNCLNSTGADGVMIAEGSLHNPALFHGINSTIWEMVIEYLNLVKQYPCPMSYVRGHLFKICHHCLNLADNKEIRQEFAVANSLQEFESAIKKIKEKYETLEIASHSKCMEKYNLPFPPWICQPYVRPPPSQNHEQSSVKSRDSEISVATCVKRPNCENLLSRKKLKKLLKNPQKQFIKKMIFDKCNICPNPKGTKCLYQRCKSCCKHKTYSESLDCTGHKFTFKSKMLKGSEKNYSDPIHVEADKLLELPTNNEAMCITESL